MIQSYSPILVVDDSAVARKIVRAFLYQLGFTYVREAGDGAMALDMMGSEPFALVISDWEMRRMDGPTLLRTIRTSARWQDLPFILVTGSTRHKYSELARDNGATFFLRKPFTAEALGARISALAHGRRAA